MLGPLFCRIILEDEQCNRVSQAGEDDNYFGRYLGSFRPVKEPWQKKAGKARKNCKGQKMAGKTKKKLLYGR
jgi:hypothetical protein